ncbi:MAG: helix-turn-helix transcriptional regulator [Nitrososphaerota archaeon]|jgi:ArsR family transcriptional regulator|nr:helix-turn-helix transcriptional regulator [Nitrososphaerota archaeon]MDG6946439.1 helix-turn-helix transcriptional regulator [Nitrososphaerota archaeon]MDG6947811.1 helix-turn-helix transcriptional regulator [Nitrososphaerota archaeon]
MSEHNPSLRRLILLNICQPSDISEARAEAEKLATPASTAKLRQIERLFGAVGEANRLKILLLLSKKEKCVCELEAALGMPQPTVSHHLGVLEQAGLVKRSKKGRWAFYGLAESPAIDLIVRLAA